MPSSPTDKTVFREILLGFWKIHILHHASQGPVVGQWMIRELRHHGYEVSPGTLYPLLRRLEGHGWLRSTQDASAGIRAPRSYVITQAGRKVLNTAARFAAEFQGEADGRKASRSRSRLPPKP